MPHQPFPRITAGVLAFLLGFSGPAPGEETAVANPPDGKPPTGERSRTYDAMPWRFSASAELRQMEGDFDTGHDISITQLSATVEARRKRFDASLTQLYLDTRTTGTGSASASPSGSPFFQRSGGGRSAARGDVFHDESGLGDTYAEAGYLVGKQEDAGVDVRLSAGVKFPTADERKGLGTGETDVFARAGLSRWEGDNVGTFRIGETFMGDPPGVNYRDSLDAALGVGHRFHVGEDETLIPRAWLRGRESVLPGGSDPVEFALTLDYDREKAFFTLELAAGLTAGAPDSTVAIGMGYDF